MTGQEVTLREWKLDEGAEITLEGLREALRDANEAAGTGFTIYDTTIRSMPAVAISGNQQYMRIYYFLDGAAIRVETMGSGAQISAEDLVSKKAPTQFLDEDAWEQEMAFYQSALGIGDFVIGGVDSDQIIAKIEAQAKAGNAVAQYTLGAAYAEGRGVEVDAETALEWYAKAAANGEQRSQGIVAQEYLFGMKGYDAEQKETGIRYLSNLAEEGYPWAAEELLDAFARGSAEGIPADYEKTAQIAEQYAAQGDLYAAMVLAKLSDGTLTEDPSRISRYRNETKAFAQYKAVADANEPSEYKGEAALRLAQMYQTGTGTQADPAEAIRYYEYASDQGSIEAKAFLAEAYTYGEITPQDPGKAGRYANEIIRSGDARFLPAAYYCSFILADQAQDFRRSTQAARAYVALPNADLQTSAQLNEYIRAQTETAAPQMAEGGWGPQPQPVRPQKKSKLPLVFLAVGIVLVAATAILVVFNLSKAGDTDNSGGGGYDTTEPYAEEEQPVEEEQPDEQDYSAYLGSLIESYDDMTIASEQDALDLAVQCLRDQGDESDLEGYEYDSYYADGYGYVIHLINGQDEQTGEYNVVWSVLVSEDGEVYYWNDGSTDWLD